MKKIKIVLTSILFLLISMFGFSLSVFAAEGSLGKFNYPEKEEGSFDANMFVRSAFMYKYSSGDYNGNFLVAAKKNSGSLKLSKGGYTPTLSIVKDYNPFSISAEKKKTLKSDYGWTDNEIAQLDNYQFAGAATAYSSEWAQYVSFDCDVQRNMEYKDWICTGLELLKPYLIDPEKFDPNINDEYLPMLNYKLSKKFGLKPANDFINYNIHVNWDHMEKQPYSEELDRYNVEVRAVLSLENLNDNAKYKTVTLENTTSDHLSFGAEEVAESLGAYPGGALEFSGYIYNICIRTRDTKSSRVSYWKTWVVTSTGAGKNPDITPGTKYYDKDGKVVKGNDGNDIVRPPSDDSIDNSGYKKDPDGTSNTAKKDPKSDLYEDADGKVSATGTLSSIKQIILSLGDVPKLLALCLTWLPSSFTTLIGAALSMIVIIGVIRWLK